MKAPGFFLGRKRRRKGVGQGEVIFGKNKGAFKQPAWFESASANAGQPAPCLRQCP